MEEFGRTNRLTARRLAVAALIGCTGLTGHAVDPPTSDVDRPHTFRSLLAEGWSDSPPVTPSGAAVVDSLVDAASESVDSPGPRSVFIDSDEQASIVRPSLRTLDVPFSVLVPMEQTKRYVPGTTNQPGSTNQQQRLMQLDALEETEEEQTDASVTATFAELIQRHAKPLQVLEPRPDTAHTEDEFVPTVRRLGVDRPVAVNTARQTEKSTANVKVAQPINTQSRVIEPQVAQAQVSKPPIVERKIDEPEAKIAEMPVADKQGQHADLEIDPREVSQPSQSELQVAQQQIAESADSSEQPTKSVIDKVQPGDMDGGQHIDNAPATSMIAKPSAIDTPVRESEMSFDSVSEDMLDELPTSSESDFASNELAERSRRVAVDNGFDLLPLDSFGSDTPIELGSGRDEPTSTTTIHATRLRQIAREALRNSSHRLQRHAVHSAKKYALEALRSIVAMRDAQVGGNQHAKQLDVALDAIRESNDFCGRFGVVDHNALKRMVAVHETEVLKGRDLEDVSSLEATETYLAVAKQNLIVAAGGAREASDALVLLGKIEKQISDPSDTHAAAVAVTLQRAAIEVAPTNGSGYRELGSTLLEQGLVEQAAWALSRSIEIQPTRRGYQSLLDASRRLGDVETARHCLDSLNDPSMGNETPVRTLSPELFASTYKPNLNELKSAKPQPAAAKPSESEPTRVSLRTLFPFSRR